MTIAESLNSELLLSAAIAVFGTLWSAVKAADLTQRFRNRQLQRALLVLQAAVDETYRTYVEAIKAGRADGRLSVEERLRARELAKARAFALARREGVNLLATVGAPYLDLWVARAVRRLKGK